MSSTYIFLKGDNDGGYRLCGLTALPIGRHFEWEMNGDKKDPILDYQDRAIVEPFDGASASLPSPRRPQ